VVVRLGDMNGHARLFLSMKRINAIAFFVVPPLLLFILLLSRPKAVDYDVQYTNVVTRWSTNVFFPLTPFPEIVTRLSKVKMQGSDVLSEAQRAGLTDSILNWFKAYSDGNKQSYLAFRFPTNVPWHWKTNALETMSNYFTKGIIFDSSDLRDAWMRHYGEPDNITNILTYVDAARLWSPEKCKVVREHWITKYGDGTESKAAYRPRDPFEQWLTIANEQAGTNWWSNYWTGVCIDTMIIRVSIYTQEPEPLDKYPFTTINKRAGYDVEAPFPNLGYGRMHGKSYIEWDVTYPDLLQQQGSILMANILCFFQRDKPDFPQPELLRLVYIEKYAEWVPFEMIDANPMKTHLHTQYF
jgi:hypothetical protein